MKTLDKKYQGTSTLEVLEGADNYNNWIADSLKKYINSPVIELGAGTGNISDYFLRSKKFTITEIDDQLLKILKNKYRSKSVTIKKLDLSRSSPSVFRSSFKSAIAVNVFEHIKNDTGAMRNASELLGKNGRLVILVPAKRFAYTRLDKNLGHFRRYEPDELREKLVKAGYRVEKLYYFNFVGLFSWMIRDKIEKQHLKLDKSQIALFDRVVPVLRKIEEIVPVPTGISIIAVARKNG